MKPNYILGHYLIAGIAYRNEEKIDWWKIEEGTEVVPRRERFNPHDPLAVNIRLPDGRMLGYLRRDDNPVPSALMDQGATLSAKVVEIRLDSEGNPLELRVELALEIDSEQKEIPVDAQ